MRRLAFLLRPSWLILAVLVAAFAYLCFTVLAPWQLGKNTDTSERNELIAESVDAEAVDVTTVLDNPDGATEWRRVVAEGTYVPDSTALVRLRHLDGAPGYAVLAAFQLTDGRILLVDRGLVGAVDGSRPPRIAEPPTGQQRVEARVRRSEGISADKLPTVQDGYRQVYSVDTEQETTVLGLPITPVPTGERGGYLQLTENQPGAFTPTPLPQLDAGPYLSYGLQWLAFGIMAPLGLGYFVYAEMRERRKERAANASAPNQTVAAGPPADHPGQHDARDTGDRSSTTESPAKARTSNEDRLADRYGRARK
ncbi:SURF1 family protein [Nocardia cyriacigeorgica]|uniref:SURF1-like protein n=1 Tax=Nocardia cyriacigeorgica TaxID=135487 RepID=A0A6P1D1C5_9NOCA|nr:SURF1 family protein [Nocardia cyriacigeorgica]NEW43364.1 SURF1 family protein [Nocardia cyriacigeorgica]NEW56616.1 SURF1 family protein [Nocardia cyriacigeorgica]